MKFKEVPYVIVQAGGLGTRMEHLVANKPKGLISINGKPILYHLFDYFSTKTKFIIIADYKSDILKTYLSTFPPKNNIEVIVAKNNSGSVDGLLEALELIPENVQNTIIWSDLLLNHLDDIDFDENQNYIGVTQDFNCRYFFGNNQIKKELSNKNGICGIYLFKNKNEIKDLFSQGEFCDYLIQHQKYLNLKSLNFDKLVDLGTLSAYEKYINSTNINRFFNKITFEEDRVIKECIDEKYQNLINKEIKWYKKVLECGFDRIPKLLSETPFILKRLSAKHIPDLKDLSNSQKEKIVEDIFLQLEKLHNYEKVKWNSQETKGVYLTKTLERVNFCKNLIPFFDNKEIKINGIWYKNLFHKKFSNILENLCSEVSLGKEFCLIHGDCTFSNILVDKENKSWFIDPRGYFFQQDLYGDPLYDYGKLYYSIVGNYDQFNRGNFRLSINQNEFNLEIKSNSFEIFENYFKDLEKIKIIHGLIWLSLSGYIKDNVDGIIGSFINGIKYLNF